MTHDGYTTQIHGVLAAEERKGACFPVKTLLVFFYLIESLPLRWTSQTASAECCVKKFLS